MLGFEEGRCSFWPDFGGGSEEILDGRPVGGCGRGVVPAGCGREVVPAGCGREVVPAGCGRGVFPADCGRVVFAAGGGREVVEAGGGREVGASGGGRENNDWTAVEMIWWAVRSSAQLVTNPFYLPL